jgi:hypothetical protein
VRVYRIALRDDDDGCLDDVVARDVETFRAERMDRKSLFMCCNFEGGERLTFWVRAVRRGGRTCLDFVVRETPGGPAFPYELPAIPESVSVRAVPGAVAYDWYTGSGTYIARTEEPTLPTRSGQSGE